MKLNNFFDRVKDTHKGDYGYVFILGGSLGLTGAVCLCARAALYAGCGGVVVGIPESLNAIFEIKLTEAMTLPLPDKGGYLTKEAIYRIEEEGKRCDIFAIGNGASRNKNTQSLLRDVVKNTDKPLLIDADGINALSGHLDILKRRRARGVILTPHLEEFSRLIKLPVDKIKRQRKTIAKSFAYKYNLVLVLKGFRTIVTDGKIVYENSTGNPGMATAGSGDVLAGVIAGLWAQRLSAFSSAKLGVYLHGLAGDLAAEEKTQISLIAFDLIKYLPEAIKKVCKKKINI